MSAFASLLADLNIFKSFADGEPVVAVKGDQVFLGSLRIFKTSLVNARKNFFKLLAPESSLEEIKELRLNNSESLLAIVSVNVVSVVSTKELTDFESPEVILNAHVHTLAPFEHNIKSVLWHPASPSDSVLVVLTEKELLLFDIVISTSEPLLKLPLDNYDALRGKTILSITFGSKSTLAGLITLYIIAESGEIFAIYPFLFENSRIRATKLQVFAFYRDCEDAINRVSAEFPPAALRESEHVAMLLKQFLFASSLEKHISSTLYRELGPDDEVDLVIGNVPHHKLQGPLAFTGPNAQVLLISNNDVATILVSAHRDGSGNALLTYLGQFQSLIMDYEEPSCSFEPPKKPTRAIKPPKEEKYAKPSRGFGFVVLSDSEEDAHDDEYDLLLAIYNEHLGLHNLKLKLIEYFRQNYSSLSTIAVELSDIHYKLPKHLTLQNLDESHFLVAADGDALICDTSEATASILASEDTAFEVKYRKFSTAGASAYAFVRDVIEGSGTYVVALSEHNPATVFQVENFSSPSTALPSVEETKSKLLKNTDTFKKADSIIPAEELQIVLSGASKMLPKLAGFDLTSVTYLEKVHQLTLTVGQNISNLTKFMVMLQAKIAIQAEELSLQTQDLDSAFASIEDALKILDNEERIEKLKLRQESLLKRQESLHTKFFERFEKHKASLELPISKAEKEWFKEINEINKVISVGDEEKPSIISVHEKLEKQVKSLLQKEQTPEDDMGARFRNLHLGADVAKLKNILIKEKKKVTNTKMRLRLSMSEVEAV